MDLQWRNEQSSQPESPGHQRGAHQRGASPEAWWAQQSTTQQPRRHQSRNLATRPEVDMIRWCTSRISGRSKSALRPTTHVKPPSALRVWLAAARLPGLSRLYSAHTSGGAAALRKRRPCRSTSQVSVLAAECVAWRGLEGDVLTRALAGVSSPQLIERQSSAHDNQHSPTPSNPRHVCAIQTMFQCFKQ